MSDINTIRTMRKFHFSILTLILPALMFVSCEDVSVDEIQQEAPVVETFSPTTGYAGCELEVTGTGLHNVVAAKIGGVEADIVKRVSDSKIVIRVPALAVSGAVELTNAVGTGTSSETFTMEYPAPSPDITTMPSEVELASNLLIFGQRMSVVTGVMFTAAGNEPHTAEVVSQNDKEIVVKVPYVEADDAEISFQYYNGQSYSVGNEKLPVKVMRFEPKVSSVSTSSATIGDVVTLQGEYLDKINEVTVDGTACTLTQQTPETVKFIVPELSTFVDGDNNSQLEIVYFDGIEKKMLNANFTVKVPLVFFWEGRKVWGQGRDVEELTSFFSPQTGIAYANSMWRDLDWVSYQYQAATCSAVQVPAVNEAEYNSVVPYFFFTGVSAGNLQINSPAGSASMLKNIFWENNSANDYRVTGQNGNCYGTPVLTFLVLDENTASHAALIAKVRAGNMDDFNAQNYPIDTSSKKMGDISISSVSNNANDTKFAPGVFTVGQEKSADLDSYILILYYNYKGLNSSNRAILPLRSLAF